jgi:serine/threonine protein kinase
MLQLDPAKRITASDALQHPLFDDIRSEYVNNFTNKENFPLPVVNKD